MKDQCGNGAMVALMDAAESGKQGTSKHRALLLSSAGRTASDNGGGGPT
jgi:hypothetical protein